MQSAAIVLAGGRSMRMGAPKATLDWHGSSLLERVTGLVARGVDGPVVVVRAAGQVLPALDPMVEIVADAEPDRGPLEGLHAGLSAIAGRAEAVYVSSTDVPLLHPRFVRCVVAALSAEHDVVLPFIGGHRQTLSAAYRGDLLTVIAEQLERDRLRPGQLFERCRVLELDADTLLRDPELARLDPQLDSVVNLNDPGEYERASSRPPPLVRIAAPVRPLADRSGTPDGVLTARAWTVGRAAAAVGLELSGPREVRAHVDGNRGEAGARTPLAEGDLLTLLVNRTAPAKA